MVLAVGIEHSDDGRTRSSAYYSGNDTENSMTSLTDRRD